jgi:hypothetical protein
MSDESDETRVSPFGDAEGRGLDDTVAGGAPAAPDDATVAGGAPAAPDDATKVMPPADSTSVMPPADSTSVMPPAADDWAPSRANPVWSGRAEVRTPQPARTGYDADWADVPPPGPAEQRDRWWMPIVVGFVVLVMLGVLAWAIYLIVQNSGGDETPATTPSTPAAVTPEPTSAPTTSSATPSSEPTTTTPSSSPATTEPTTTEVNVPALRGLSLADARAALDRTGLQYRVLYRDSTAPAGTVIDSDPEEGQEVPPDTRVTIVVSQQGGATTTTATPTTKAAGD